MPATAIGYYDMVLGTGNADQLDEIVEIGQGANAVSISTLSAAVLATLKVLVVQNPENAGYSAAFLAALPDIRAAVANGMTLIVHDRAPQVGSSIFPEGTGIEFVRNAGLPSGGQMQLGSSGSLIASTAFGVVTDTSVDNYDSSNHGYVLLGSLPAGALVLMTTEDPTHVTAFVLPVGAGRIIYTSAPVDFWGDDVAGASANLYGFDTTGMEAFARNILAYAVGAGDLPLVLALNDTASANEGVATVINVLGNDTYNGKGTLKVSAVGGQAIVAGQTITLASGSTVKLNANGTLTYTTGGTANNANLGQTTDEGFTYTVSDGINSATASIAVAITGDYTRITGTGKSESLNGTAFDDTIDGKAGMDILYGNAGNDILNGGGGGQADADQMYGGVGDDTYYVDSTRDAVNEGFDEGHDKVIASVSAYTLTANVEDLELTGGALNGTGNDLGNAMRGNGLANILNGVGGHDELDGQGGNDTLYGGAGGDALLGGTGADTFVYKAVSDSEATVRPPAGAKALPVLGAGANTDVIYDLRVSEGDRIDLTAIDASTRVAGNNDFVVVSAFTKVAGQMTVKTFGGLDMKGESGAPLNGNPSLGYILEGDTNGDGMADFTLLFNSPTALTVNDLKTAIVGVSTWNITSIGSHASAPSAIQTTIPDLFH